MNKVLFLLILFNFVDINAFAKIYKIENSQIICIEKSKSVCLKDLTQNTFKVLFSISDFPIKENWRNIKIVDATLMKNEIIEILIFQETIHSFFNEKEDLSCLLIYRYDFIKEKLLHKEYNIFHWGSKIERHILIGDSLNNSFKSVTEASNKIRFMQTGCINNKFYFVNSNDIYVNNNCNEIDEDLSFSKPDSFGKIEFPIPYNANNKLCMWGFDELFASNDNQFLIFTFYNQKALFNWRKKSVSDIIEFNTETMKINTITNYGRNASYSIDKDFILYEKVHKPSGYKKVISQGYFVLNRKINQSIFIGDCIYAVFLKLG